MTIMKEMNILNKPVSISMDQHTEQCIAELQDNFFKGFSRSDIIRYCVAFTHAELLQAEGLESLEYSEGVKNIV